MKRCFLGFHSLRFLGYHGRGGEYICMKCPTVLVSTNYGGNSFERIVNDEDELKRLRISSRPLPEGGF